MVRVSVLELPARWDGARAALEEIESLLALAPTDLAIVPEMALVGYVSPDGGTDLARFAEAIDGPTMQLAAALARSRRTALVVPLVLQETRYLYNASVLVAPDGSVLAVYRKRHPWFPERWATPGVDAPPIVELGGVRVTFAICYDGHFLATDTRAALTSADLLVFTSAWVDEDDTRLSLLEGLARTFGLAIANANWGPGVVVVPGQGGSCVLDANGAVLAAVSPGGLRRADAEVHARIP